MLAFTVALGCAESRPRAVPDNLDAGQGGSADAQVDARVDAGDGGDAVDGMAPAESPAVCYRELDCEDVDCDDYTPKAPKCELGNSFWTARYDGDCGDYRYRFDGGMFYGSIRIWDRATGKLVVAYHFSDNPVPCQSTLRGDREVYEQCEIAAASEVCAAIDTDAGVDQDGGS